MGWTEKQLTEENSADFLYAISKELQRQDRINKQANAKLYGN